MKYFDIIAEIQPCEHTSRETDDKIPKYVTPTKYLKRRKVKRK